MWPLAPGGGNNVYASGFVGLHGGQRQDYRLLLDGAVLQLCRIVCGRRRRDRVDGWSGGSPSLTAEGNELVRSHLRET